MTNGAVFNIQINTGAEGFTEGGISEWDGVYRQEYILLCFLNDEFFLFKIESYCYV